METGQRAKDQQTIKQEEKSGVSTKMAAYSENQNSPS